MKKWSRLILLCLLLGAITTWGVAWGCARYAPQFDDAPSSREAAIARYKADERLAKERWHILKPDDRTEYHSYSRMGARGVGWRFDWFGVGHPIMNGWAVEGDTCEVWAGFPFYCFRGYGDLVGDFIKDEPRFVLEAGGEFHMMYGSVQVDRRYLPYRIVASGAIGNLVVYAAAWCALLFGPVLARRAIRHRAGRCPNCGYNLRGEFDEGCSECGWNRSAEGTEASRQQGISARAEDGAL